MRTDEMLKVEALAAEIERINSAFDDCAENAEAWKSKAERLAADNVLLLDALYEIKQFSDNHEAARKIANRALEQARKE